MEELKYTGIKNRIQYNKYCEILEGLIFSGKESEMDEIELLELLIEKWDNEQYSLSHKDPVELIKALMTENNLKSRDLIIILDLSKGTVSKILNYQKGLSKETIRNLSNYFKISQETFNRPYKLKQESTTSTSI